MAGYDGWWALAGGWATDRWLGAVTRDHHDVEMSIRRVDQQRIWDHLNDAGFELFCLDPPGSPWRPWNRDHTVSPPAFQTQARKAGAAFDVFLESGDEGAWVFRRNAGITRPLTDVAQRIDGLPVLRPEVQLLYMATSIEPKNQHDAEAVIPRLDQASLQWLSTALAIAHPGHRWIAAAVFERRRQAWLAEDAAAYVDCFAEAIVLDTPTVHVEGRADYARLVGRSLRAMRPVAFDFHHLATTADNEVLAEWTVTLEHRASGKRITYDGMSRCRLGGDGRIATWREYYDPAQLTL
jgi:limonene-1,2-epoxide hydrolase